MGLMIVVSSTAAWAFIPHAFHSKASAMHKASSFSQFHYGDYIAKKKSIHYATSDPFTRLAEQPRRGQASSFKHHIVQMVEHLGYTMAQVT
jgi:hypothetical protein